MDPETGKKNYVNPFEERRPPNRGSSQRALRAEASTSTRTSSTTCSASLVARSAVLGFCSCRAAKLLLFEGIPARFHPYTGPVYKQVPVVEGLEFPLDPNLYYPPLEPPPPGAKWGGELRSSK